eukprot:CAMPEP_0198419508 /NCGR_PEP_ID=MMETSP1452-20131203/258_1 /TAXON_ID=1181717 /ORGANISM="Synchroma pusillum, Strain CCMP3072" /LENGTH=413 /DNA_ID=CAMNT_0044139639 /DNA_START=40 /DNA_END=1281 /DNA_ORIENTATION=-
MALRTAAVASLVLLVAPVAAFNPLRSVARVVGGKPSSTPSKLGVATRPEATVDLSVAAPLTPEEVRMQPPPFTLADMKDAIPEHCFKRDAKRSASYLVRDLLIVAGLAAAAVAVNNPLAWVAYWFAQGTMFWALFVVGHDCGHQSFSENKALNDFVGHMCHSSILVPYHGWRISHRTHHQYHGNIDLDESWYPMSKTDYDNLDLSGKLGRYNPLIMLIAYPIYLWKRTPGRDGSHFLPTSPLFKPSERNDVLTSTAGYFGMIALLIGLAVKTSPMFVLATYGIPNIVFCAWLSVVTYLHHTDDTSVWFRGDAWTYLRGALNTRDRDYGIFNNIHHDIGTHVVHHALPLIPHYHLREATEAVKPLLGDYYVEPTKSGILPVHLVKEWLDSTRACKYVADEGDVVMYESDVPMKK